MYNDGIVQVAAARLNSTLRWHRNDSEAVAKARNELLAARVERAIQEALHPHDPAFKPLAREDRKRLADALMTGEM